MSEFRLGENEKQFRDRHSEEKLEREFETGFMAERNWLTNEWTWDV